MGEPADARLFIGGNVMEPREVALAGYRGMTSGRSVVILGVQKRAIAVAARMLPHALVARIARWSQERRSAS